MFNSHVLRGEPDTNSDSVTATQNSMIPWQTRELNAGPLVQQLPLKPLHERGLIFSRVFSLIFHKINVAVSCCRFLKYFAWVCLQLFSRGDLRIRTMESQS